MAYGTNAPFGLRPIYNHKQGTLTSQTRPYNIYTSRDGSTTQSLSMFTGDPITFSANGSQNGTICPYLFAMSVGNNTATTFSWGSVTGATALSTQYPIGVFAGCQYTAQDGTLVNSLWWKGGTQVKAGTQIIAYVYDDPDIVYDIQVSSPTSVWQNACFPNFGQVTAIGAAGSAATRLAIGCNAGMDFTNPGAWTAPTAGTNWAQNPGPTPNPVYTYNTNFYPYYHTANANYLTTGNPQTGQSNYYLTGGFSITGGYNSCDYAKTTSTLPLKIIGITPNIQNLAFYNQALANTATNNVNSTVPFLNVLVMFNLHTLRSGTVGQTFG